MEMKTVTYQEVIDGYEPENDDWGVAAYTLAEPRKSAFLNNPLLVDKSKTMLLFAIEDGRIVGRSMFLPSKFKAGDVFIDAVCGSAVMVADEYRSSDAGILLMSYAMQHKELNVSIGSGFSREAVKCHKALGSKLLTFPRLVQIRSFTKILPEVGVPVWMAKSIGWIGDILTAPFRSLISLQGRKLRKHFTIKRVEIVPKWVDDIVINDGHRYMEVHDHKWLQWNLDNKFHDHIDNTTSFYTVEYNGENIGFYMITERYGFVNSNPSEGIVFGSIVEWGTKDENKVSEYQLQLMALTSFSDKVDLVFTSSTDNSVVNKLKRLFIIPKGEVEISFKDMTKNYKDAKDKNLWRLRLGYADTILG